MITKQPETASSNEQAANVDSSQHDVRNGSPQRMARPLVIAVDFDGTCVTHEYPKVGRFIGAEAVLRALVADGHKLILWTMRSGEYLADAVRWFAERGIPLLGVNENPTQKEWTQSPKAYAQLYIDDAALGIPLCAGLNGERPFVDWDAVRALIWPNDLKLSDGGEEASDVR